MKVTKRRICTTGAVMLAAIVGFHTAAEYRCWCSEADVDLQGQVVCLQWMCWS
ncbi:hypothetical protein [Algicola sagamiensis]|uniref:hypothetical protein n=1 Tax=Algicola sagamiensis TaxID=163869 RepID=UPI0003672A4B|nr:hypothetical protein [Algicola sagamiensis]